MKKSNDLQVRNDAKKHAPSTKSAAPKPTSSQQNAANTDADFDAKHTNSPLCACRDCNAAWLARRDLPTSQKHTRVSAPPIDIANKKPFAARCKKLNVSIELKNEHNTRIAYWVLVDVSTHFSYTAGFDTDVASILTRMEADAIDGQGKPAPRPDLRASAAALHAPRASGPVRSSSSPNNLTGGPFCVVCDVAGGLPCPAMVRDALRLELKLAYPPGDARLLPAHVHPGRCRKRLRQLLDAGTQAATGKAHAKHNT